MKSKRRRTILLLPANTALRCHSNKADRSSRVCGDGVVGRHMLSRTAKSLAAVIDVSSSVSSARRMVVTLRAVARTRSSATWARPGPAGIPVAAAGAMGRAPWRRARARTPPDAAARTFLADPLRAAGGGQKGRRSATRPGRGLQRRSRPSSSWRSKITVVSHLFGDLSSCRASYFKQIPKA
jgi:hypothetical protein